MNHTLKNPPQSDEIRKMFDRLAPRYDRFNRLVSLGLDGLWRTEVLKNVSDGQRVLDLGCGTGDLALGAAEKMASGEVVGLDFSPSMLEVARSRALKRFGAPGGERVTPHFVEGSALDLPMDDRPFDVIVSGFVLRNIYEHIERIVQGMRASLRTGGRIALLDFIEPGGPVRRALWKGYMRTVGWACGWIAFGKDCPSLYMTESAARFLKPEEFCALLRRTGFVNIRLKKFMMGIIVLYEAEKA